MNDKTKNKLSLYSSIILLLLSILLFILIFLNNWYRDQILDSLFIFAIGIDLLLFIFFSILIIASIIIIVLKKKYINFINIIILIISAGLFLFFPFRETKVKYEVNKYESIRLEIIEKIIKKELTPDSYGNVVLPNKYKKVSTSGEVHVYQNNEKGRLISFWVFLGMMSGSYEVMYSTGGEELIKDNESGHPIRSIEKLKDKWYYVGTDY